MRDEREGREERSLQKTGSATGERTLTRHQGGGVVDRRMIERYTADGIDRQ